MGTRPRRRLTRLQEWRSSGGERDAGTSRSSGVGASARRDGAGEPGGAGRAHTPHKWAWFHGDPQGYHELLAGTSIEVARGFGGLVEVATDAAVSLLVGDGVGLRYHGHGERRPEKHQLLIEFEDGSALSASVQMYGGIWCFAAGQFDNAYYAAAQTKPSPLSAEFDEPHFARLLAAPEAQKLSAKAFLATEQRIPGLGNVVLQDILWQARLNPKRKMNTLSDAERASLFGALKSVLASMTELGGRDTEKDLFGRAGGYRTIMSKNNAHAACPGCGELIRKENYLGGSVYYCGKCQAV